MNTKSHAGVRIPQAQVPEFRIDAGKATRVNGGLVAGVAVLTVAVVALGAALIVESSSEEPAPTPGVPQAVSVQGLASQSTVARVDEFLAAYNADDPEAMRSFFDEDSLLMEWNNFVGMMELGGMPESDPVVASPPVERVGPVLQVSSGPYPVVIAFSVEGANGQTSLYIQQWFTQHTILRMWII